jgi:hypothetical protein
MGEDTPSTFQPYGSKPSESGIFLQRTKAVILYPRILLPRMPSAGVPEIFSKRRNAVVAGRGNDPDQKGTISKLHPSAARNSPTARASAGTAGLRRVARFGRTPCANLLSPPSVTPP